MQYEFMNKQDNAAARRRRRMKRRINEGLAVLGIFILCFNCLVVVSDRDLCGGGEDGVDVNEENDFSGDAQRPGAILAGMYIGRQQYWRQA